MSLLEKAVGLLAPIECTICGLEGFALCEMCQAGELLPHGERCGLCGRLSPNCRTCSHCRKSAPSHIWISTDYEGAAQKLLQAYKFRHQRHAAESIASIMAETLHYFEPSPGSFLIVAVPTATSRVRSRSFDHAALLAKNLSRLLKLPYSPALIRLGQARQLGAKRADRLTQQTGAYAVPRPTEIEGKNILLIDDVITTGSTLRSCTKALRQSGARRVEALVFAKRL